MGTVVHGDGRGRTLGFPTANVLPQPGALPPNGVYAVEAILDGAIVFPASPTSAHGRRSPAAASTNARLEVHLLDFQGDLYGTRARGDVPPVPAPERRFANAACRSRRATTSCSCRPCHRCPLARSKY
jgi:riboflavin kinase/FMN adenylyltransferase